MLRRTHVYKNQNGVALNASFNGTPVQVLDRTGFSMIAKWAEAAGGVQTFTSAAAEITDVTCLGDTGVREITTIDCVADTGVMENAVVTFPAVAGAAQADYIVISNIAGTKWAAWLDIDAAGIAPTGADFLAVPVGNRVMVSITTGQLAPAVAAAAVSALGTLAGITITDNLDGTVDFDQTLMGNATDIAPHNANDSGVGSITIATTPGVNSNLNSTYFTISSVNAVSKVQKDFFVWFNVNSEGVAPVIAGKTAVPVAIAAGAADTAVATAVKNALAALTNDFGASAPAAQVTVTNVKIGNVTDAADGMPATGFTIATLLDGVNSNLNNKYFLINSALDAVSYYVWFSSDGLGTDPALVGKTGVMVPIVVGSQADTDVAAAVDAASITGIGSSAVGAVVTFTNAADGATTNATAGTSGFTVLVTTQGVTSVINLTGDTVSMPLHGYVSGQKVAVTTSGAIPTGIPGTAYIIVVDPNTIKFASSKSNALLGSAVNISSEGTGVQTLTRQALNSTLKLQASNDFNPNINPVVAGTWSDITGSTVTMAGAGDYGWNVSDVYYAWVRLVYTWVDGDGSIDCFVCVKD